VSRKWEDVYGVQRAKRKNSEIRSLDGRKITQGEVGMAHQREKPKERRKSHVSSSFIRAPVNFSIFAYMGHEASMNLLTINKANRMTMIDESKVQQTIELKGGNSL
jgi:hypothetical protein